MKWKNYKRQASENLELAVLNKKEAIEYREAIQRVRDLHKPIATQYSTGQKYTGCAVCGDEGWDESFYPHEYPCDTIKALDGDL